MKKYIAFGLTFLVILVACLNFGLSAFAYTDNVEYYSSQRLRFDGNVEQYQLTFDREWTSIYTTTPYTRTIGYNDYDLLYSGFYIENSTPYEYAYGEYFTTFDYCYFIVDVWTYTDNLSISNAFYQADYINENPNSDDVDDVTYLMVSMPTSGTADSYRWVFSAIGNATDTMNRFRCIVYCPIVGYDTITGNTLVDEHGFYMFRRFTPYGVAVETLAEREYNNGYDLGFYEGATNNNAYQEGYNDGRNSAITEDYLGSFPSSQFEDVSNALHYDIFGSISLSDILIAVVGILLGILLLKAFVGG